MMNSSVSFRTIALAVCCLMVSTLVSAQSAQSPYTGELRDAWLQGKVETVLLLNRHLNSFRIDSSVDEGVVELSGEVSTPIEKDLAMELVKGIDGVDKVENRLEVTDRPSFLDETAASVESGSRKFASWADDVTTTAIIKSKLLGNANTKGLAIKVDTQQDEVTLSGQVTSPEERQLAQEIAANTGDVATVHNQIEVIAKPE